MSLLDSDFNAFALALTQRFSQRSKGLDTDSRRLLVARPSDQILAGFLTPRSNDNRSQTFAAGSTEDDEEVEIELADDLPRDSAYEQTSIGLEWLGVLDEMTDHLIDVKLNLSVYVRRLPTFEEQNEHKVWERPRLKKPNEPLPTNDEIRVAKFASVWTREDLPTLTLSIDMNTLKNRRRVALDVSTDVSTSLSNVDKTNIYPGRRALTIAEPHLANKASYEAELVQFTTSTAPVFW